MLQNSSEDFRKFFLLQFTRQLIKNSAPNEFWEQKVKEGKKELKEEVKQEIKKINNPLLSKQNLTAPPIVNKPRRIILREIPSPILRIPKTTFPQRLQYLKPTPTDKEIDLEKLNPLIKDPMVSSIECGGADQPVMVIGKMGRKKSAIKLTKQEITQIIEKFSKESKIPVKEGILKIAVGRLILSAIVSNVISSRFIIKKIPYIQNLQNNARQNNPGKNRKIF